MCGICGIVNFAGEEPSRNRLSTMTRALEARGPDGEGLWIHGGIGLGHRRLAIIDLSERASQPMVSGNGRVCVTFNGEIYNYRDLRRELEKSGARFRSGSDTEVLLEGYLHWGLSETLSRCRGMWAFALWDDPAQRLFLARDRFGKKPLFYVQSGSSVLFSSTLNSLRAGADLGSLDLSAIAEFLTLSFVPPDRCAFSRVKKVPAGSWIEFDKTGSRQRMWWSLEYSEQPGSDPEALIRQTADVLKRAVSDRLVADVEVGAFLSGGVDSGFISTLMADERPGPRAFTMSVDSSWRDESNRAETLANLISARHHLVPVSATDVAILPWLITQFGEPFADSSMIPTALVARAATREVKVVLTGDGGDEVFGGYGEPAVLRGLLRRRPAGSTHPIRLLSILGQILLGVRPLALLHRGSYARRRWATLDRGLKGYLETAAELDPKLRRMVFGDRVSSVGEGDNAYSRLLPSAPDLPEWKQLLWLQNQVRLQGDFLVKVDVGTMSFGLEARCPFLDHRLAEFLFGQPWELWQLDGQVKGLLKKTAERYLPRTHLDLPKHGFTIPCEDYLFGAWKRPFVEMIDGGVSEEMGIIRARGVRTLLDKAPGDMRRRGAVTKLLFSVFCLEVWLRTTFLRSETPQELAAKLAAPLAS